MINPTPLNPAAQQEVCLWRPPISAATLRALALRMKGVDNIRAEILAFVVELESANPGIDEKD